jgi:Eukaryotic cytochrome b561
MCLVYWFKALQRAQHVQHAQHLQHVQHNETRIMQTAQLLTHWLLTPLSGSELHQIAPAVSWHGRLMVLAWAVCLPLGVLAARFFKVLPHQGWPAQLDHKAWWHSHRVSQSLGVVLAGIGVYLIYGVNGAESVASADRNIAAWHGYAGWTVTAMGLLQVLGGVLRGSKGGPSDSQLRGDHYDMTTYRRVFETVHKTMGYAALLLAAATIVLGLIVSDAPRWMVLSLALWWLGLLLTFIRLQRAGRCMDTYQAIWGPSNVHPGNTLAPAGWGSLRYTAASFDQYFGKQR